jgi:hypothetical protein
MNLLHQEFGNDLLNKEVHFQELLKPDPKSKPFP